MRKLASLIALAALAGALLIALPACDEAPSLDDAQKAMQKAGDTMEKAKGLVENLDTSKVKELAQLAADLEKNPDKATEMLKEHGLDKEQFQKAVDAVSKNPELKKVWDAALEAARKAQ